MSGIRDVGRRNRMEMDALIKGSKREPCAYITVLYLDGGGGYANLIM